MFEGDDESASDLLLRHTREKGLVDEATCGACGGSGGGLELGTHCPTCDGTGQINH